MVCSQTAAAANEDGKYLRIKVPSVWRGDSYVCAEPQKRLATKNRWTKAME